MNIRIHKDAAHALTELGQDWNAVARHLFDEYTRANAHDPQRQFAEVSVAGRHFVGQVSRSAEGEVDFFVFMPSEEEVQARTKAYLQEVDGPPPTHDIPAICRFEVQELLAQRGIDAADICYRLLDSWWEQYERDPRCSGTSCDVGGLRLAGKAIRTAEGWQFAVDVIN